MRPARRNSVSPVSFCTLRVQRFAALDRCCRYSCLRCAAVLRTAAKRLYLESRHARPPHRFFDYRVCGDTPLSPVRRSCFACCRTRKMHVHSRCERCQFVMVACARRRRSVGESLHDQRPLRIWSRRRILAEMRRCWPLVRVACVAPRTTGTLETDGSHRRRTCPHAPRARADTRFLDAPARPSPRRSQ